MAHLRAAFALRLGQIMESDFSGSNPDYRILLAFSAGGSLSQHPVRIHPGDNVLHRPDSVGHARFHCWGVLDSPVRPCQRPSASSRLYRDETGKQGVDLRVVVDWAVDTLE